MNPETVEIIDAAFTAARGVTERYDRAWYLKAKPEGEDVRQMWKTMAEQGLLGLGVPAEYGGLGGGMTGPVAVMEAMSEAGTPCYAYILTAFCIKALLMGGSEAQKRRWIPSAVSGDWRCCFAITEPTAGTNTFNIRTRATRTAGGYRISGEKVFTSCANVSDSMMIVARTNDGPRAELSLFVVDLPCKGISMQQLEVEMYGPEKQFAVFFDNVEVPEEGRIGAEAAGKDIMFHALNPERFLIAAWSLGLGNLCIKKGSDYARTRAPFGKPIGGYQSVAHPLAHAKMNLEAARLMLYAGCEEYDAGSVAGLKANMAKYLASTAAGQAIEAAIQLHGGHAWDQRTDIIQLWPMIRLMAQSPINNQMLLNYVAERVLDLPRSY